MQYLAPTSARNAVSGPHWNPLCQRRKISASTCVQMRRQAIDCLLASGPSRLAQSNDAIYIASKRQTKDLVSLEI